jgi:hypothetical protein
VKKTKYASYLCLIALLLLAPSTEAEKILLLKQHYGKWFYAIQVNCIPKSLGDISYDIQNNQSTALSIT